MNKNIIKLPENLTNSSDLNHCRCFKIDPSDIELCRKKLIEFGFEKPIAQEDHGQVFGLRRRHAKQLQIHFKVMSNGIIESELEPPPEYPAAHLDPKHSYSPHNGIPALLDHIEISYTIIHPVPESCSRPKIISPDRPLKWLDYFLIGVGAVAGAAIVYSVAKESKK